MLTETASVSEKNRTAHATALQNLNSAVDTLRDGFDHVAEARALLARECNSVAKINQLPLEVLCMILKYSTMGSNSSPTKPLLPPDVATVCFHWRSAVITWPVFWSIINVETMSIGCARLCHHRARGQLITMLSCDPFESESIRELLVLALPMVEVLDITSRSWYSIDDLTLLTTSPASPLLTLEKFSMNTNIHDSSSVFDEQLFGGQTPALRHLKLAGTRLPWNHGFYNDLLSLEIRNVRIGKQSVLDDDICHILRDCPRLRKLSLGLVDAAWSRIFDPPVDNLTLLTHSEPTSPIPLPFLRSLRLEMPPNYMNHILSSITAVSVLDLEINLEADIISDADSCEMALSLPMLFPSSVFPHLDTLIAHRKEDSHGWERGDIHGEGAVDEMLWPVRPNFTFTWDVQSNPTSTNFNDEIFSRLAQAVRPHLKPSVTPLLSLQIVDIFPPPCPSRLLSSYTPSSPSTALGPSAPSLQSTSTDKPFPDDLFRMEELELTRCELTTDQAYGLWLWSRNRNSLCKLRFVWVAFSATRAEETLEHFAGVIDMLAETAEMHECRFIYPEGSETESPMTSDSE